MTKLINHWQIGTWKRKKPWYVPWEYTLLYLPIDDSDTSSTVYDHSWNAKDNTWYWTSSYDTLASGKRVLNFTWSNGIYISSAIVTSQPCTINLWLYRNWNQSLDNSVFINQHDEWRNSWGILIAFMNTTNLAWFYWDWTWVGTSATYTISNQTWTMVTVTLNNNTVTSYVNGVQVATASRNAARFSDIPATSIWFTRANKLYNNTRFMIWKISDVIVENTVWDSTKATAYFNLTKEDYWL